MEGTPNDIDLNAVIKAISKDEKFKMYMIVMYGPFQMI